MRSDEITPEDLRKVAEWHRESTKYTQTARYLEAGAAALERCAEQAKRQEGHDEKCYYCGELCNAFAANPGLWPIPGCHIDDPGVVKWHHEHCVFPILDELKERCAELTTERDAIGRSLQDANEVACAAEEECSMMHQDWKAAAKRCAELTKDFNDAAAALNAMADDYRELEDEHKELEERCAELERLLAEADACLWALRRIEPAGPEADPATLARWDDEALARHAARQQPGNAGESN